VKWREKSLEVLDEYEMKMMNNQEEEATSIYMNSIQGRKLNCCIENSLETHNVYMFLITKQTQTFAKFLYKDFKCDFLLIKFELPFNDIKPSIKQLNYDENM